MTTLYNTNTIFKFGSDYGSIPCDTIYTATLAANTDISVTVPGTAAMGAINASLTNRYLAVFTYTAGRNVYVAVNNTAAVPAGGAFAASNSQLLPLAKTVKSGDVIHMICATAATDVCITLYALPEA